MTHDASPTRSRRLPAWLTRRMSRGAFFGALADLLLVALAGGAVAGVTRYLQPRRGEGDVTNAVVPEPASQVAPGTGLLFPFGKRPALLVCGRDGAFTAFLATCTHLACTVTFDEERQLIVCPCHQGLFDLDGTVLSGPPPRPLERLEVEVADDTIHVFRT